MKCWPTLARYSVRNSTDDGLALDTGADGF